VLQSEDAVNSESRNKRLRLLLGRLNKERRKQAKQVDILCNDLITAQKQFIRELQVISFSARFFESIIGLTDINELLATAANRLKEQIPDTNVAFFLLIPNDVEGFSARDENGSQNNHFEMHIFESSQPIDLAILCPDKTGVANDSRIENLFTAELIDSISQSNRLCTIDDMLAMGLAGNPRCLENVSAIGLPLNHHGCSLGFVLLYRTNTSPFTREDIKAIEQLSEGLSRSIFTCRTLVGSV
jgi:hypothetical protein